jgi:O-antigen ligase
VAALLVISVRGLVLGATGAAADPMGGINVMKGIANKNAFSLYALPALLIGGWLYTRLPLTALQRALIVATAIAIVLAVFSTANRSGWIGVGIVGVMIFAGRMSRAAGLVVVGVFAVYLLIGRNEETRTMVERRFDQTVGVNDSDEIRRELFIEGMKIGLENPLLGVSPHLLQKTLARRLAVATSEIETHNVYAYVAGASGMFALAAFFWMMWTLAFPRAHSFSLDTALPTFMVVLCLYRGAFTHETLFSPTFAVGLGLGVAWIQLQRRKTRHGAPRTTPGLA